MTPMLPFQNEVACIIVEVQNMGQVSQYYLFDSINISIQFGHFNRVV